MSKETDIYEVCYGKYKIKLSRFFLENNKAEGNLEAIKDKFKNKFKLFTEMDKTDDSAQLKELADKVTENEFEIQELFNFSRDANFHRFWEMPKCKCPVMDNQDYWGLQYAVFNSNCPIHGVKQANKEK